MEYELLDDDNQPSPATVDYEMLDEPPPLKNVVGVSDQTAKAQRGLANTKAQVDDDTTRGVLSWPARFATGVGGFLGDMDQLGRNLDARFGFAPPSETRLPTQDSLMERGRGMVSPEAAATFLHEPRTMTGKIVNGVLDFATPSVAQFTGKGRRALEGGLERLDMGADKLRKGTNDAYRIINNANVGYAPADFTGLTRRFITGVGNSNLSPKVRSFIDGLGSSKMVQRMGGNPIYFHEIEETYKKAGSLLAGKISDNDARVLTELRNELDNFRRNTPTLPSSGLSGSDAMDLQEKAREFAKRNIKDKRLARMERLGERQASNRKAGSVIDAEVNKILRNERLPLDKDELAQLKAIGGGGGLFEEALTGGTVPGALVRSAGGAITGGLGGYATGGDFLSSITGAAMGAVGGAAGGRFGDRVGMHRRARELDLARKMARVGPDRVKQLTNQSVNPLVRALLLGGTVTQFLPDE